MYRFPMDVMTTDKVSGSLDGTLYNGATLAPGVIGNALDTQATGAYIDFGTQISGYLYNPDECALGITFSFWIKLHAWTSTSKSIFPDNGVYKITAVGFCIAQSTVDFGFTVRQVGPVYKDRITPLPISQWYYVIAFYLNGCLAPLIYKSTSFRTTTLSLTYPMMIGNMTSITTRHMHASMNHLVIWYSHHSQNQDWQLYLLGGNIW